MSIINFDDLLGRTFLLPMDENGERKRATISEHVNDLCQEQVSREDHRYIAYFRAVFKNTSSMRERSMMETTDSNST